MKKYTVRLIDGTIGTICDDTLDGQSAEDFIGEIMNIHLFDEEGFLVEVEGKLVEVLDMEEF